MKQIKLTQERFAFVDDADFEELNKYRWFAHKSYDVWYAQRWAPKQIGKRYVIHMHRTIMQTPDDRLVDHIDRNGLNNQRANLRNCTKSQNLQNQKKNAKNTSGFKGVSYHKGNRKWQAYIRKDKKRIYLGIYKTAEEASLAYQKAAKELFNKFARI